jgi:hypothetical protein
MKESASPDAIVALADSTKQLQEFLSTGAWGLVEYAFMLVFFYAALKMLLATLRTSSSSFPNY